MPAFVAPQAPLVDSGEGRPEADGVEGRPEGAGEGEGGGGSHGSPYRVPWHPGPLQLCWAEAHARHIENRR